ncbi:MAG: nucleotidyltransferase family protein [Bacteroidales bacterium]|nr:nucleotidyltransferase family protein [Bacteroidales bacterium]
MGRSWAIILAAGSSSRMGRQKLLMPFGKSTMIETVIDQVLESSVDQVMVVLGADHEKVRNVISQKPVKVCHNRKYEEGMLSSVICGIRALPQDAVYALIFLGDQPEIPPAVSNLVMESYEKELNGIIIPVCNHRRGHPLLVDMKYRKEVENLDLEQGLRSLRHQFPEDVLEVEVDEPGILVDIDTPEDYKNATN